MRKLSRGIKISKNLKPQVEAHNRYLSNIVRASRVIK